MNDPFACGNLLSRRFHAGRDAYFLADLQVVWVDTRIGVKDIL
jgi:hypothetical protein